MRLRYFSAFSGIGVAELAIQRVFPDAECVGMSEIDPTALSVYRTHFGDTHKNFGDIRSIDPSMLPPFDLFVFGSPCTDISSFQFKRLEWQGTRSILFFEALRLIRACRPRYILMENVASMRKERRNDISCALGLEPVLLDSAFFGAQHRRRLYWANFPIAVPGTALPASEILQKKQTFCNGMGIESVLEKDVPLLVKPLQLTFKNLPLTDPLPMEPGTPPYAISHYNHRYYLPRKDGKCNPVLTTASLLNVIWDGRQIRYMTSVELERLQTLPDNYTQFGTHEDGTVREIPKTRRQKLVGNAFHLETFVYLLRCLEQAIGKAGCPCNSSDVH